MEQLKLLRDRRFVPHFWTQFLTAFNDNFLKNAIVILIAFKEATVWGLASSQMVAVAGGIFILPFFLFSATAGQLADKFEKTRLIRIIKVIEVFIMAFALAGFALHQYGFLLVVLFLMGLHSTFFGPIKYSILPQLLKEHELVAGNALVEAGSFIGILAGTILGGLLVTVEPFGPTVAASAMVAVAAIGYLTSRWIPTTDAADPKLEVHWNPVSTTWEIYRFTRENRTVFLSIMGISWFWAFGAAFLSLFPPYVKETLNGNEHLVTLFLAVFSIGIAIGSALCERLSFRRLELGLVPFGSIGMTFFTVDLFLLGNPFEHISGTVDLAAFFSQSAGFRIVFDLLLIAIFAGLYIVPLYTLVQERSDASHRSRVLASNNVFNALYMVAGAGVIMALHGLKLSVPQIFGIIAAVNAVVSIYIYSIIPEFFLRFLTWMLAHVFYRVRVTGLEKVPANGPAILVCNHVTFVDWLFIAGAVKRPVRFVMDYSYIPKPKLLRHLFIEHAKVIPIAQAKENPALLQKALDKIAAELQAGEVVCIFPEGRLTRDGELSKFRPGVEKILSATPVPVVPMALQGLWGSMFSWKDGKAIYKAPRKLWSRIGLTIGAAIPPERATAEELQSLVAGLRGESR